VIQADTDQFAGACRDWYAAQHFLSVSDANAAVAWTALDSPLVTLQDINRGQWYDRLKIENGNVFAYVFNNYWWTNYKASQGGPLTFRFSMTSARRLDDIEAKQFGESVQDPFVCELVKAKPGGKPAESRNCVAVAGSGLVLQAVKPARFTNGTVICLREMAGKSTSARVTTSGISFKRAWLSNLAEDKLSELPIKQGAVAAQCRAFGLTTIILER
jgi:alpha-mannosidase